MEVEIVNRPKGQPLAEDYMGNFSKVSQRFEFAPWDPAGWQSRAEWLDQLPADNDLKANRVEVVAALRQYNEGIGNAEEALRTLDTLAQRDALVVVGGQQAGLFTGPLLVIHKAITILQAARDASVKLQRPVVPVFWIAGEDHDFDEVNHWYALTSRMTVEKWKLDRTTERRTSISKLSIPAWDEALVQMEEWLPPSDFKPDLMDRLHTFSQEASTLTAFFAKIMAWLFGKHGLVLLDSDDPSLRRVEAPFFKRLLLERGRINDALLTGRTEVESMGYKPQAEVSDAGVNLFRYDDNGERVLLLEEGGLLTDRKRTAAFTPEQLLEQADSEPARFSNNVFTRPLMQDYLLPVLACVLGPGEISYWALTKEAFRSVGMRMPVVLPRMEFTLVEGTVRKNMEKFGWSLEDVTEHFEEKKRIWLQEQDQLGLEERFNEVRDQVEGLYKPLLDSLEGLNPSLKKLGDTNLQKIKEQIDFMKGKAMEAGESRYSSGLRQLEKIRLSLAPLSKPQERVYNVFAYLNRYGTGWLDELVRMPLEPDGKHRMVYL